MTACEVLGVWMGHLPACTTAQTNLPDVLLIDIPWSPVSEVAGLTAPL